MSKLFNRLPTCCWRSSFDTFLRLPPSAIDRKIMQHFLNARHTTTSTTLYVTASTIFSGRFFPVEPVSEKPITLHGSSSTWVCSGAKFIGVDDNRFFYGPDALSCRLTNSIVVLAGTDCTEWSHPFLIKHQKGVLLPPCQHSSTGTLNLFNNIAITICQKHTHYLVLLMLLLTSAQSSLAKAASLYLLFMLCHPL